MNSRVTSDYHKQSIEGLRYAETRRIGLTYAGIDIRKRTRPIEDRRQQQFQRKHCEGPLFRKTESTAALYQNRSRAL